MRAEGTKRVENLLLKNGVKKIVDSQNIFSIYVFQNHKKKKSHSEINAKYIFNNFIKTLNCLT